jgi:hypothetical protein
MAIYDYLPNEAVGPDEAVGFPDASTLTPYDLPSGHARLEP